MVIIGEKYLLRIEISRLIMIAHTRCHSNIDIPPFRYPRATYPRIICIPVQNILRIYGIPSGTPWEILNPLLAPRRSVRVGG